MMATNGLIMLIIKILSMIITILNMPMFTNFAIVLSILIKSVILTNFNVYTIVITSFTLFIHDPICSIILISFKLHAISFFLISTSHPSTSHNFTFLHHTVVAPIKPIDTLIRYNCCYWNSSSSSCGTGYFPPHLHFLFFNIILLNICDLIVTVESFKESH